MSNGGDKPLMFSFEALYSLTACREDVREHIHPPHILAEKTAFAFGELLNVPESRKLFGILGEPAKRHYYLDISSCEEGHGEDKSCCQKNIHTQSEHIEGIVRESVLNKSRGLSVPTAYAAYHAFFVGGGIENIITVVFERDIPYGRGRILPVSPVPFI